MRRARVGILELFQFIAGRKMLLCRLTEKSYKLHLQTFEETKNINHISSFFYSFSLDYDLDSPADQISLNRCIILLTVALTLLQ